jgi:hypothetical protein
MLSLRRSSSWQFIESASATARASSFLGSARASALTVLQQGDKEESDNRRHGAEHQLPRVGALEDEHEGHPDEDDDIEAANIVLAYMKFREVQNLTRRATRRAGRPPAPAEGGAGPAGQVVEGLLALGGRLRRFDVALGGCALLGGGRGYASWRSASSAWPLSRAQCAQQNIEPPASWPWPMIAQPQCAQRGAIAWIAHSNESNTWFPLPTVISIALS